MENCLLTNFIFDKEIKSSCDFNQFEFADSLVVYEVIRVINEIPLFLEDHLERFFRSLEINELETDISHRQIKSRLKALIEINKLNTGNIRFQLAFPKNQNAIFYAWVSPFFYPSQSQYEQGVNCSLYLSKRPNPNAKLVVHKIREATAKEISSKNVFEVILHNQEGEISEGSKSNLFFIKNNSLFTSPAGKVLIGVTRTKVFDLCKKLNIEIVQKSLFRNELIGFESAFLSGTSIKLLGIKTIDKYNFTTKNPILELLTIRYEELIQNYLKLFKWNL